MCDYSSDSTKESLNLKKHHVEFRYAFKAIQDTDKIKIYDEEHSGYNKYGVWEVRWKVIGKAGKRILIVSYCERGDEIRIISSRRANKTMRRRYNNKKKARKG